MPALRIVTYDLNREGNSKADYKGFYAYFEKMRAKRLSESCYVIETDAKPSAIFETLKPFVDENDHVLVLTLAHGWFGRHQTTLIDWLTPRLEVE